jgi:hypothetical protein
VGGLWVALVGGLLTTVWATLAPLGHAVLNVGAIGGLTTLRRWPGSEWRSSSA